MKIFLLDTAYPQYISSLPDPTGEYETELQSVLSRAFGTADFYSHYLRMEGHECADVIANHTRLQRRWAMQFRGWESGSVKAIVLEQIAEFKPDVLFCQDLSFLNLAELSYLREKYLLAGQISCRLPNPEYVSKYHVLFTSFPFYVARLKALGVPTVEYLPLAFDPRMLSEESPVKHYDISFVGGVGKQSHWKAGTEMLERVAAEFKERFVWFGYGRENLEAGSPLHACYAGPAWGREMYSVYGRSKIVVNRHGEVAEGYSNNLRMYEATGMGALLLTEHSKNIFDLFGRGQFAMYASEQDAIINIEHYLERPELISKFAKNGQQNVLQHHTYAHRMKFVSDVLTAALVGQAA